MAKNPESFTYVNHMMWNTDEDGKKTLTTTLMVDDYLRAKYLPMVESFMDSDNQEDSSDESPMSTRSHDKHDRKRPNFTIIL